MACRNKPAGAIKCSRRLKKRSITNAKAMTEHNNKGQSGQPAACMIENNAILRCANVYVHYGLGKIHRNYG